MGGISLVASPSASQVSPGVCWSRPRISTSPCTQLSSSLYPVQRDQPWSSLLKVENEGGQGIYLSSSICILFFCNGFQNQPGRERSHKQASRAGELPLNRD